MHEDVPPPIARHRLSSDIVNARVNSLTLSSVRVTSDKCFYHYFLLRFNVLGESATQMVEVIWPLSVPTCRGESGHGVLPLRTFIQETLRRSRTSFSTLQVALYYLILIKAHVPKFDFTMEQPVDTPWSRALQCGRRMFLAALILASKYLQDRNYSARAWSKISGLTVCEINTNEMAFLQAVNWKLHVSEPLFERWQDILIKYTSQQPPSPGSPSFISSWRNILPRLTPELDTIGSNICRPFRLRRPQPPKNIPACLSITDISGGLDAVASPVNFAPPRVLEPAPTMLPPTPSLVRMGPLPTPILTPQSAVSNTPAVSYAGSGARRLSFCSAMARAQREALRSNVDCRWPTARCATLESNDWPSRRPSVVSSDSSLSSPESMVSDTSSRCSRTSSVSSASSISAHAWAPTPVKLARLATLRSAGQTYALPQQQQPMQMPSKDVMSISIEPLSAEPMSSPDFDSFHISDLETPNPYTTKEDGRSSKRESAKASANNRKRGRSSVDITLQQNVRNLLSAASYTSCVVESPKSVLDDEKVAQSFLLDSSNGRTPSSLNTCPKAAQSPARSISERRLPVTRCCGRKRACCATEADLPHFEGRPRMWQGVWLDA